MVSIAVSGSAASISSLSFLANKKRAVLQVLGASLLLAFCSQIKITLPFTPVPLTMQTLAVLMIGATMGYQKAAWTILAYFTEILMGLPVLSGATADPLIFLGPKGGYVLGFLLQACLMGWVSDRIKAKYSAALLFAGLVACSLQLGLGVLGLAPYVGWEHVWMMGLYPFIAGEVLKVFLMCFFLRRSSSLS